MSRTGYYQRALERDTLRAETRAYLGGLQVEPLTDSRGLDLLAAIACAFDAGRPADECRGPDAARRVLWATRTALPRGLHVADAGRAARRSAPSCALWRAYWSHESDQIAGVTGIFADFLAQCVRVAFGPDPRYTFAPDVPFVPAAEPWHWLLEPTQAAPRTEDARYHLWRGRLRRTVAPLTADEVLDARRRGDADRADLDLEASLAARARRLARAEGRS